MAINWDIVARVAAPILALFVGAILNRAIEKRPKLIAYFLHSGAINLQWQQPFTVNNHGIIIKNIGRLPANNVRVRHYTLPDFSIFPPTQYRIEPLPGNGAEIVLEKMIPDQQIYINYLYVPPLTFDKIHAGIASDEGFAKQLSVVPARQFSKLVKAIIIGIFAIGCISIVYLLYIMLAVS